MRPNKVRLIVSEALTYRGYSKAEADMFIKLLTASTKENKQVRKPVSKIDIYV